MTTESAKIIIDAEDLASKKFEQAARNAEKNIKAVKETGKQAKASTEFFGVLANTLGGSELAGYAGQLGQLTDKVSQFSEVSKAGGAGALAFKAGLASVVGVLAFQVGKAIGDVIFQTKQMTRELDRAREAAEALNKEMLSATSRSFSNEMEDIELIRNPEEKEAAAQALLDRLNNEAAGVTGQLKQSQKAVDEWADAWQITGNRKEFAKQAEIELQNDKARLEQVKAQRDEVRRMLSERTKENALIAEKNALQQKSDDYLESLSKELGLLEAISQSKEASFGEIAAQNTFGDAAKLEAEQLLAQIDALKLKQEEEKKAAAESERLAAKAISDAERVASIRDNEIAKLREQRIELEQGAEAAKVFALEQQGLDTATAKRLAAEFMAVEELKKQKAEEEKLAKEKPKIASAEVAAVESRLLTRGKGEDQTAKVVNNTKRAADELMKMNRRLDQQQNRPQQQVVLRVGSI